jgi:hypothetical protein
MSSVAPESVASLVERIDRELRPGLVIECVDRRDPVVVRRVPEGWELIGTGNYAVVVAHPSCPKLVVKVYAPGRTGFKEEVEAYRKLGKHHAYSRCYHAENGVLVLRRLHGVTFYDALSQGIPIPERVIHDVDAALDYARRRGLRPHDVHGRNVIIREGRGMIVDVADFLEHHEGDKWDDLKAAYYRLYRPLILRFGLRIPRRLLDTIRHTHQFFRRVIPRRSGSG